MLGTLNSRLKCPGHDKRRTTEAEPSETQIIFPNKVGTEAGNGMLCNYCQVSIIAPILSVLSAFRVPFPHGPMFPCFHVSKALMSAYLLTPHSHPAACSVDRLPPQWRGQKPASGSPHALSPDAPSNASQPRRPGEQTYLLSPDANPDSGSGPDFNSGSSRLAASAFGEMEIGS